MATPDQYRIAEAVTRGIDLANDPIVQRLMALIRVVNITAAPPAHIQPPVFSDPVDLSGQVTVPAAVGAYQTIASFQCPLGRWGSIQRYGVNVLDAAYQYTGSLLWRFRLQGRVLDQGLSNWGEQRGSLVNMRPCSPILIQPEWTLVFQVRRAVAAGAPQVVQGSFAGYTWRTRNTYEGTQAAIAM